MMPNVCNVWIEWYQIIQPKSRRKTRHHAVIICVSHSPFTQRPPDLWRPLCQPKAFPESNRHMNKTLENRQFSQNFHWPAFTVLKGKPVIYKYYRNKHSIKWTKAGITTIIHKNIYWCQIFVISCHISRLIFNYFGHFCLIHIFCVHSCLLA